MIDEQLYQQATDELNSDRRRPHLWARACALASDDHDEARYLYTNLRVEELIAERERTDADSSSISESEVEDQVLSLEPMQAESEDKPFDMQLDSLDDTLKEENAIVSSALSSSRSGVARSTELGFDLEAHISDESADELPSSERSLMNMELDDDPGLDLSPGDLAQLGDLSAASLEERLFDLTGKESPHAHKAEGVQNNPSARAADQAIDPATDQDVHHSAAHSSHHPAEADDHSGHESPDALAHTSAGGQPLANDVPEELDWLEQSVQSGDSLLDDASADRPGVHDNSNIVPAGAAAAATAGLANRASDQQRYTDGLDEIPVQPGSASFDSGLRDDYADARDLDSLLDQEDPGADPYESTNLDTGRGPQWVLYESPEGSLKAVKRGVSWAALLFTLPWLLIRGLIGSAIAYALLWVVSLGGLMITGLAWMDGGAGTPDMVKLACAGFGLVAFLGLVVVPFFRGNRWREQRYKRRGYAKLSKVRARSGGSAIERWTQRIG